MDIKWVHEDDHLQKQTVKPCQTKGLQIDRISVGHNRAEIYVKLDETVIIMPPEAALKFKTDLHNHLDAWEKDNGTIPDAHPTKASKEESVSRKVIKQLYKSRKIGPKLLSINTKRRKHPTSD